MVLLEPTETLPNDTSDKVAAWGAPEPVTVNAAPTVGAEASAVTLPLYVWAARGENRTLKVQLLPAANVAPQVELTRLKPTGAAKASVVAALLPEFVSVT